MIVGQMALCSFPLWEDRFWSLLRLVDVAYVRFDARVGNPAIPLRALELAEEARVRIEVLWSTTPWDAVHWREEMLRMLDPLRPDIVLSLDEDEQFTTSIMHDVERLKTSAAPQLAFEYVNPTVDGWDRGKAYPSKPHVKAYRWRPGLTYLPYQGRARLASPGYRAACIMAESYIRHYCFYTPELRAAKVAVSTKEKKRWAKRSENR